LALPFTSLPCDRRMINLVDANTLEDERLVVKPARAPPHLGYGEPAREPSASALTSDRVWRQRNPVPPRCAVAQRFFGGR
jgi:hypothetical protein